VEPAERHAQRGEAARQPARFGAEPGRARWRPAALDTPGSRRGRGHGAAAGNRSGGHRPRGSAWPGPISVGGLADRPARGGRRAIRCPSRRRRGSCRHAGLRHGHPGPADVAGGRRRRRHRPPSNRSSRSTRATGCTGRARRRPGTCRSPSTSPPPGSPCRAGRGTATLTLTVACGPEPAGGHGRARPCPTGSPSAPEPDLRYDNSHPDGYAAWDLTVRAAPGTAPGRYFAAARIRDEHGHVIEDTAMVAVGERRWPDPSCRPRRPWR
jgi:hypothetical protein